MVKPEDAPAGDPAPSTDDAAASATQPAPSSRPAQTVSKGYAHLFKYIMVGDSGCGKSALLRRYVDDVFPETYSATIGVDFAVKTVSLPNGDAVKLQVWDTAGQERFRTVTTSYYRGAMGIFVVYDVTDSESADSVQRWLNECERLANDDVKIVVIGNKSDLKDQKRDYVSVEEVKKFDEVKNAAAVEGFFETSAKTGAGVEAAFQCMTDALVAERLVKGNTIRGATRKIGSKQEQSAKISLKDNDAGRNKPKKKCC